MESVVVVLVGGDGGVFMMNTRLDFINRIVKSVPGKICTYCWWVFSQWIFFSPPPTPSLVEVCGAAACVAAAIRRVGRRHRRRMECIKMRRQIIKKNGNINYAKSNARRAHKLTVKINCMHASEWCGFYRVKETESLFNLKSFGR